MKKEMIWGILALIIGILIGMLIHWQCMTSCKQGGSVPRPFPPPSTITVQQANAAFHLYETMPDSTYGGIKALNITMEQYDAMGMILDADTSVHGFRIYLGADSIATNRIMMVVGTGSPDKGTIYKTGYINPCPYVCDGSSGVTQ